jgi:hypothetical protein
MCPEHRGGRNANRGVSQILRPDFYCSTPVHSGNRQFSLVSHLLTANHP